ncbi:phenylalanine--tRNA ligase subunit alpha [Candidatus Puniceispirillum marinum]|uniref:Phenylalanine--tRNA ligase alpha subunit n=1 Tax=Puniceispirillum marinum (strain IMCC1322) TaxID=488538 RepID=D5BT76_PUNMI|nr:phenylalanine--tRNA ligase subunit alpha [Candidatus Puniceispirillum marinum]ADE39473.1 Phenylalanyl-tRNA synthetase, alpha subunit [Candidatus Puniceispirillum marinum IMCC1322]
MQNLEPLSSEILAAIDAAETLEALDNVRIEALGKKGRVSLMMRDLGGMEPEARKQAGQDLNVLKDTIAHAIETRQTILADAALAEKLSAQRVDVSLPSRPHSDASLHPLSRTIEEVVAIFAEMGFTVAEGPDIESDYYNFTALNIPEEHPARQEHDTFYLPPDADGKRKVLRTHTSPVQVRTMETSEPPIRIIVPGRTYRSDHDATHSPMFHQCEGLVIGDGIHMGHLKGCLIDFCRAFFGVDDLPVRFRPSYFPFTEPSAEVDIGCTRDGGGLKIGAGDDWLEILGSGMVNPRVLENCGYDPDKYQGFAFGMGIERIAMLKYGIPDLRTFYDSDLRWMRHYGFLPFDAPSIHAGLVGGSV